MRALTLDPRGLGPADAPALIGVSGGRDSVALLHALRQLGGRELVVCHFDHALRPESAAEAEFVAARAHEFGLPFEFERQAPAARPKQSLETAAREARHAFFARVAARLHIAHLYLAHHADDQAETFLFHLLRGSGVTGLRAMLPAASRGPLTLLRPLLGTWRAEIDAYLAAHQVRFCEDPTNRDLHHTRNRLRHEIIPQIETALGRQVRPALWRAAEILAAEDDFLRTLLPAREPGGPLKVIDLRALPLALQRRTVRAWLCAGGVPDVAFEDVENVVRLLTQRTPAKVNLAAHRHARRRSGAIFLE